MRIVVTGGTGFIGGKLVQELLHRNHTVVLLTRNLAHRPSHPEGKGVLIALPWDGRTMGRWASEIDGADAIINLAGEPIAAGRWSKARKTRIEKSRIDATRTIVDAIHRSQQKPKVLISGSAVGYYGNVRSGEATEDGSASNDFLGRLCVRWEEEATKATMDSVRVVLLRTGIVLAGDGGALPRMIMPFKFFAGGPIGSGKQWMPWIHRDDEIRAIIFALENENISGPINLAAPAPVTMKEFATTLGQVLHRPSWAPVPGFVLKGVLGEMSEMLLTGQRAVPKKLCDTGFTFTFSTLRDALNAILRSDK